MISLLPVVLLGSGATRCRLAPDVCATGAASKRRAEHVDRRTGAETQVDRAGAPVQDTPSRGVLPR